MGVLESTTPEYGMETSKGVTGTVTVSCLLPLGLSVLIKAGLGLGVHTSLCEAVVSSRKWLMHTHSWLEDMVCCEQLRVS